MIEKKKLTMDYPVGSYTKKSGVKVKSHERGLLSPKKRILEKVEKIKKKGIWENIKVLHNKANVLMKKQEILGVNLRIKYKELAKKKSTTKTFQVLKKRISNMENKNQLLSAEITTILRQKDLLLKKIKEQSFSLDSKTIGEWISCCMHKHGPKGDGTMTHEQCIAGAHKKFGKSRKDFIKTLTGLDLVPIIDLTEDYKVKGYYANRGKPPERTFIRRHTRGEGTNIKGKPRMVKKKEEEKEDETEAWVKHNILNEEDWNMANMGRERKKSETYLSYLNEALNSLFEKRKEATSEGKRNQIWEREKAVKKIRDKHAHEKFEEEQKIKQKKEAKEKKGRDLLMEKKSTFFKDWEINDEKPISQINDKFYGIMNMGRTVIMYPTFKTKDAPFHEASIEGKTFLEPYPDKFFLTSGGGKYVKNEFTQEDDVTLFFDFEWVEKATKKMDQASLKLYYGKMSPLIIQDKDVTFALAPRVSEQYYESYNEIEITKEQYKNANKMTKKQLSEKTGIAFKASTSKPSLIFSYLLMKKNENKGDFVRNLNGLILTPIVLEVITPIIIKINSIPFSEFTQLKTDFETNDFVVFHGPIARDGPYIYQDENGKSIILYKEIENLSDLYSRYDYLPIRPSEKIGAHFAEEMGYGTNFCLNEETNMIEADLVLVNDEKFKEILKNRTEYHVSPGYSDIVKNGIQTITSLDHIAFALGIGEDEEISRACSGTNEKGSSCTTVKQIHDQNLNGGVINN